MRGWLSGPRTLVVWLVLSFQVSAEIPLGKTKKIPVDDPAIQRAAKVALLSISAKVPNEYAEQLEIASVVDAITQDSEEAVMKQRAQNFFGLQLNMEAPEEEKGTTSFIIMLVAHFSPSVMVRELNPWPFWQMSCSKLWAETKDEYHVLKIVTPERKLDISPHALSVRKAADAAVLWLTNPADKDPGTQYLLAGVLAAEKQTLELRHLKEADQPLPGFLGGLAVQREHKPTDWTVEDEIDMYYITTLLEVRNGAQIRFEPHMFALSEPRAGGNAVVKAHYALDSPGTALVTWAVAIRGYDRNKLVQPKARQLLREMIFGLTAGEDWHAGLVGASNIAIRDVKNDQEKQAAVVSFSIGCAGDGKSLVTALRDPGSISEMVSTLNKGGIKVGPSDLSSAAPPVLFASSTMSTSSANGGSQGGGGFSAAQRQAGAGAAASMGVGGGSGSGSGNTHWLTIIFSVGVGAMAATVGPGLLEQLRESEAGSNGVGGAVATPAGGGSAYQQVSTSGASASSSATAAVHEQL